MRYAIVVYTMPDSWQHAPALEAGAAREHEFAELIRELQESGELVDALPLDHPALARTVTASSDGSVQSADGPYAGGNKQLTQYFVLDVADLDRATEIASYLPQTCDPGCVVELRPTADGLSVDTLLLQPPSEPTA